MSTYSPNLRIELISTGDQAGTWGNTTNTNLGTLVESAISGYVSVSILSAKQALTALNGVEDQARNASIALTTVTSFDFEVYIPAAEKQYVFYNATPYNATIYNSTITGNTVAAGGGVTIPSGKTASVWSDGTSVSFQNNHLSSLTLVTDLALEDGGTGASTAAAARTNLGLGTIATQNSNAVSITGGSISGITDLAVADGGTGASTAADARTNLGLGTIATQNASSVSITGGSVTGITDLAVADGGTGSSTAAGARSNLDVPSTGGSGASGTWGINISGNANTATSATSATSATNATNATNATQMVSGSWTIYASGAYIYFNYAGNNVLRLDSSGNLVAEGNVTAYQSV